ncbi:MAG: envelope stress response membrane protein PspB [Halieaceae bacterium]|nr:envelope stress response membrane protein PspB [Halieaceae bacterium]
MEFLEFMFVPTILFLTVVCPIWLIMHYRSLRRSSRNLSTEDRHTLEEMLVTVDKLTDRIHSLEAILDADHPGWRTEQAQEKSGE